MWALVAVLIGVWNLLEVYKAPMDERHKVLVKKHETGIGLFAIMRPRKSLLDSLFLES